MASPQGFDWTRPPSVLEQLQVLPEPFLVERGPCLNESPLVCWKGSRKDLNWIDPEHRDLVLVIRLTDVAEPRSVERLIRLFLSLRRQDQ